MKNLLLSVAIGDIAGVPYEFDHPTKNYECVNLMHPECDYSDDSVCTFAIAEAFMKNLNVSDNLWKRCNEDLNRGYGGRFRRWLSSEELVDNALRIIPKWMKDVNDEMISWNES